MNPTVLKLISGETIIANVKVSNTPNCQEISEPFLIRCGVAQNNKMVLSLMPWMESDQKVYTIRDDHIISTAIPTDVVKDHYNMYKNPEEESLLFDDEEEEEDFHNLQDDEDEEEKIYH